MFYKFYLSFNFQNTLKLKLGNVVQTNFESFQIPHHIMKSLIAPLKI